MIEYFKNQVILNGLEREKKHLSSKLITSLFKGIDNLQSIAINKSNDYDDNNYYDNVIVTEVNGIMIQDDEYIKENGKIFIDEDCDCLADEDKLLDEESLELVTNLLRDSVDDNADEFSYGEHLLTRKKYIKNKKQFYDECFMAYYSSYLSGNKIEDETIFKNHPDLAICYAYDILKERLKVDTEKYLKSDFYLCYLYAIYVIKGRLPSHLENHFNLKSFEDLTSSEKKYFKLYKKFLDSHEIQKV